MKKRFRVVIAVLIGIAFMSGFNACSNQFDELKQALETTEINEAAGKTEAKDNTQTAEKTEEKNKTETAGEVKDKTEAAEETNKTDTAETKDKTEVSEEKNKTDASEETDKTETTEQTNKTEQQTNNTEQNKTEEGTEQTENKESAEGEEKTENKEGVENQENTGNVENTENTENTEGTETNQTTQNQENTENTGTTENQENTENNENQENNEPEPVVIIEPDVSYSVEHWLESTDGRTYGLDVKSTQTLTGKKDTTTAAVAKEYQGFTAEEITQQNIKADGSTVVKVYYDRKRITYTFNANGGKWSDNSTQKTVTGLYEAIVPVVKDPAKNGAQFCNWDTVIPQTFGLENQVYEAVWLTNSLTSYKIEHCVQNVYDDDYTIESVQIKTGLPGEMTQAEAKAIAGCVKKSVSQNTIKADGSTIVRVYYDRLNITYTFKLDTNYGKFADNTTSKSITKRYGSKVEPPTTKIIYTTYNRLVGWSGLPETYGDVDKTFSGQFGIVYDSEINYLPSGTDGTAGTSGTYVYFGYWPQSSSYYTSITSNHAKTAFGSESKYVYPCTENKYYFKDPSTSYLFLMTPIKWRVVTTNYKNTGKALLVAEDILIASPVTTSTNPYWRESIIRTYLNDSFYNNAFPTDAKTLIADTDTSVGGMQTTDKVFLLSRSEIQDSANGLTAYTARIRSPTQFARMKNIYSGSSSGCTSNNWWLRDYMSPYDYINANGAIGTMSPTTFYIGVVPAILVDLPAQ